MIEHDGGGDSRTKQILRTSIVYCDANVGLVWLLHRDLGVAICGRRASPFARSSSGQQDLHIHGRHGALGCQGHRGVTAHTGLVLRSEEPQPGQPVDHRRLQLWRAVQLQRHRVGQAVDRGPLRRPGVGRPAVEQRRLRRHAHRCGAPPPTHTPPSARVQTRTCAHATPFGHQVCWGWDIWATPSAVGRPW